MDELSEGPNYIVATAPFRISFAGGGTDLPAFYEQEGGAVFSCAINKHVYVTVKRLSRFFEDNYRLNYSQTEIVGRVEDIENSIIRACLTLLPVPPPLYIGVIADVPTSSGLGASSSFAVSLLAALHVIRGERVSPGQLAAEAVKVEIELLGQPIGKQDQYVAAWGGLNYMSFESNGMVKVEAQPLPASSVKQLFDSILMFWTGISARCGPSARKPEPEYAGEPRGAAAHEGAGGPVARHGYEWFRYRCVRRGAGRGLGVQAQRCRTRYPATRSTTGIVPAWAREPMAASYAVPAAAGS